jgi:hypothetical protein
VERGAAAFGAAKPTVTFLRATATQLTLIATVALSTGGPAAAAGEQLRQEEAFLVETLQFREDEVVALARGKAIARSLATTDPREVATIGAVVVKAPPAFYAEQLRDIVNFKRGVAVLQIGRFGAPPAGEDVSSLTLEREEVDALRRCRPHACKVQLSEEAIARFQREVPWNLPGGGAAATALMRELLVEVVATYQAAGDRALMLYVDAKRPVSLAREFQAMIASKPAVLERFPLLYQYILRFPEGPDARVDDVVYWSRERMGPARVLSVTHLAIARIDDGPVAFAIASKQIYGTRYFDSSLGITVLLRTEVMGKPACLLVYVNRSRVDALGGWLGGLKRKVVRSRARGAMSANLEEARARVEARHGAVVAGGLP